MHTELKTALADLGEQINRLAADLAHYATSQAPSQQRITFKEVQIKIFKNALAEMLAFVDYHNQQEEKQAATHQKQLETIFKLELILVLHGFRHTLNYYMAQSQGQLIALMASAVNPNNLTTSPKHKPVIHKLPAGLIQKMKQHFLPKHN